MLPDPAFVALHKEIASVVGQSFWVGLLLSYGGRGARILCLAAYTASYLLFGRISVYYAFVVVSLLFGGWLLFDAIASAATGCELLAAGGGLGPVDGIGSLGGRPPWGVCAVAWASLPLMFRGVGHGGVGVVEASRR